MSNPDDAFLHNINTHLFKESQHKYNSGGEPKNMPDLEYQELLYFHGKYYHPSNATFLTYGDLDFTSHLDFIQK